MASGHTRLFRVRVWASLAAVVVTAATGIGLAKAAAAPATCADVDVVFARGTGEETGLGSVGGPFTSAVTSSLAGRSVTSYAVDYAADNGQTSGGVGSNDLVNHVVKVAASCADTVFILGGYSQGAIVVDKALGIDTPTGGSSGTAIPAALSSRVASVVVFGNPIGLQQRTIASSSPTYGLRSRDYCNQGDPVCGGGLNFLAHLAYVSDGSSGAGAQFARGFVGNAPAPATPAALGAIATPVAAQCVTASTRAQVDAARATDFYGQAFAVGTRESLGFTSPFLFVTLKQNSDANWSMVPVC